MEDFKEKIPMIIAYLKLKVKALGVHSWEEVQESELPEKVNTGLCSTKKQH